MALLTCPNELLKQIFDDCIHVDIESFALTCKQVYNTSGAARDRHQKLNARFRSIKCIEQRRCPVGGYSHPAQLAHDVLNEPYVDRYIERLDITRSRNRSWSSDPLARLLRSLGGSDQETTFKSHYSKFLDGFQLDLNTVKCHFDMAIAFMLCLLPNLKVLDIDFNFGRIDDEFRRVVSRITAGNLSHTPVVDPLPHLEEVKITRTKTDLFGAFGSLPSLRRFSGRHYDEHFDPGPHMDGSSKITHFEMMDVYVSDAIMRSAYLPKLKYLESFKIFMEIESIHFGGQQTRNIIRSLYTHTHSTLENLEIVIDSSRNGARVFLPCSLFTGTIPSFNCLKFIRLSSNVLIEPLCKEEEVDFFDDGWDWTSQRGERDYEKSGPLFAPTSLAKILPESVMSFSIAQPMGDGMATILLTGLAKEKARLSNLKEIIFEEPNDLDPVVGKECVDAGIAIRHLKGRGKSAFGDLDELLLSVGRGSFKQYSSVHRLRTASHGARKEGLD